MSGPYALCTSLRAFAARSPGTPVDDGEESVRSESASGASSRENIRALRQRLHHPL